MYGMASKKKRRKTPDRHQKGRPTISLCMIVRNEERFLGQCLKRVKNHVDEMIILDTGSTDRTIHVAESFGACVYRHPWENDFSRHRNQAISYAGGDWILVMDADEVLRQDSGPVLRKAASNNWIDAVTVTIISYHNRGASQTWENKVRLFRNHPSIRYTGIIHEQLMGYGSVRMYPIYLLHYGYDLIGRARTEKLERTLRLLEQQVREDPESYWHHHNLAAVYASHFMFKEAVAEGKKALQLSKKANALDQNLLWTYYILSSSFFKLGDLAQAERYALEASESSPLHLDSHFLLVLIYYRQKNWPRLLEASQNFLHSLNVLNNSPEKFIYMILNSAGEAWRVRLALGDYYLRTEEPRRGREEFQKALAMTPNLRECHRIMGDIYLDNGMLKQAETFFNKTLEDGEPPPECLFSLAKLRKAKGDQVSYLHLLKDVRECPDSNEDALLQLGRLDLTEGRYEEAVSVFERAIQDFFPTWEALSNLALAHKCLGHPDAALRYNQQALKIKPDAVETLTNLAHIYYERGESQSALPLYQKALKLAPNSLDISLRLASLYLSLGSVDACLSQCNLMLKNLGLPSQMTLNSLEDLSLVFLILAHSFAQHQKDRLSEEAVEIAFRLSPDTVAKCQKHPKV
jgi:tetratricopeptide (TPR) repeat protein